jgi:hypothetical protein
MLSDYLYRLVDVLPLPLCSQWLLARPLFWHTAFESRILIAPVSTALANHSTLEAVKPFFLSTLCSFRKLGR